MAGQRLVKIIQQAAKGMNPDTEKTDIIKGLVTSIDPLEIQIENKISVEGDFLMLSPLCIEKRISVENITEASHTHKIPLHNTQSGGSPYPHMHDIAQQGTTEAKSGISEILLWRGLQVGDRVLMLRAGNGNMYYVMQREGDL